MSIFKYLVAILLFTLSIQAQTLDQKVASALVFAEQQLKAAIADIDTTSEYLYPFKATNGKNWDLTKAQKWTSGFFPGCLWYMYEYSGKDEWKHLAKRWTAWLEVEKTRTSVFADLGMEMIPSFGHGFRLIGDSSYIPILIESADSYRGRYKPDIHVIESWDRSPWFQDPNIVTGQIDQHTCTELFFEATKHTGDSSYYKVAVENAETVINNHIRDDFSSVKTVRFNASTGEVVNIGNAIGAHDSSTWARGHGWGVYSLVMTYRYTRDERFLNIAKSMADYFYNNKPENELPYWDFDAPDIPNAPKDASGMALHTSALLEMITLLDDPVEIDKYRSMAYNMLSTLCSSENFSDPNISNTILRKGDAREINGVVTPFPAIFADYYFIEALLRYQKYVTTDIENSTVSNKTFPQSFVLEQNYPNPFNPETTITYQLMKNSNVRIVVYDVLGREIYELINSDHAAGKYRVNWNGQNEDGTKVSTGIYYYKMVAENFISVKKMILIK